MFNKFISLFLIVFLNFYEVQSKDFIDKGVYVIDLKSRVEWLKCSVGQQWNEVSCTGEAIKISIEEAEKIKSQVGEELGGEWRLPNKQELNSLICKKCEGAKINKDIFPDTPAGLFWTSQRNWWSPKFFWSVNFFTGHTYGRFVPEKKLFVRFLRDR
tara:strand:- start:98 stop:568 length:471 start_codon:yes stop_codon:yes gene_type:complete